jgi:hypothetical protein
VCVYYCRLWLCVAPPPPRVATSLPLAARSPSTWPTMIMTGMSNHCNDPTVGSSNGLDEWLNKNKAYPSTLSVHVHGDDTVWDDYGHAARQNVCVCGCMFSFQGIGYIYCYVIISYSGNAGSSHCASRLAAGETKEPGPSTGGTIDARSTWTQSHMEEAGARGSV